MYFRIYEERKYFTRPTQISDMAIMPPSGESAHKEAKLLDVEL